MTCGCTTDCLCECDPNGYCTCKGKGMKKKRSPLSCEHANEVPAKCSCAADCYCKKHTCKNKVKRVNTVNMSHVVEFDVDELTAGQIEKLQKQVRLLESKVGNLKVKLAKAEKFNKFSAEKRDKIAAAAENLVSEIKYSDWIDYDTFWGGY